MKKTLKITRFSSRTGVMAIWLDDDIDKYSIMFDKFGDITMSINCASCKCVKNRKNIIIAKEYAIKLLDVLNKSYETSLPA